MLKDKNVLLAVTGSIAAYKIANLASMLMKQNAKVTVLMTKNATNFINPITFETITGNKCIIDTFDRNFQFNVEHVSIAKSADIVLIAPATANIIGKLANGIADDMLTTTIMACQCTVMVAPAMNTNMYINPIVQDNIKKLEYYGYKMIDPAQGRLACGDNGIGKLPEEKILMDYIFKEIACIKDLLGKKVLVTAGATREYIDPVRFISNNSTGKMGLAIAHDAILRGADVTIIAANVTITPPKFCKLVKVNTANEMFEAVKKASMNVDIIVKAAAVADYRPKIVAEHKIKKKDKDASIELERTEDILEYLGTHKREGQFLCGFSMETENMIVNSREKLRRKNLDMIVANNLFVEGAGFGVDTNVVTLITETSMIELPKMSKDLVAKRIFDEILHITR